MPTVIIGFAVAVGAFSGVSKILFGKYCIYYVSHMYTWYTPPPGRYR